MTNFLLKLFVKDSDFTKQSSRSRCGTFASIVGIVLNVLLASGKLLVGAFAGSISIIADALNNLSDVGASTVSLVGFKISSKPADREHPFGHARMEYIASMIVSFLILLVGAELFMDSVKGIFAEETAAKIEIVTYVILSLSVLVKLWLAVFFRKTAKKIDSSSLRAASADSLSDAVSTSLVLISSVIMELTGFYMLDSIMGILVSVVILISGVKILNETKNSLLGEAPVDEMVEKIKSIAARHSEIIGIHDMMVHNYGPGRFIASFHAEVDGRGDIFKLHDVIDLVEKEIHTELDVPCSIHLDPIDTDDEVVIRLRTMVSEAVAELYPALTIHDFRVVSGVTHTNIIFDVVVPFEEKTKPQKIIEDISSAVNERDSTLFCVITVDRG